MVSRVYVEKKPGFDGEARALAAELRDIVGISGLTGVRLVNRYDVEGATDELFAACVPTVFSEPQSDTATFELPEAAVNLRFDPGELPCCITNLSFSDDRLLCVPANGLTLPGDSILFLGDDPNFRLEGLTHYPAGMKLVVSYCYFPLETLTDEPLFNAVLEGVQHFQKTWNSEARHIQQLEQANAEQQQAVDALHKNIAELHQANAELTARCQAYEKSLEGVLSSSSWRITSPFRRLLGWFHRSR